MNNKPINNEYDVVIIGAGPSGMTAALEIKRLAPLFNILIIEKNAVIGKKLKATGNGRCNITNVNADGYPEAKAFLESIGIALRTYDNGLVYPYSESAADVVELFESRLCELGVKTLLSAEVTEIVRGEAESEGFAIRYALDSSASQKSNKNNRKQADNAANRANKVRVVTARKVIIATGGKAGPGFGTIGDGYRFARRLGHTVVSPIPILTSINCDSDIVKPLAGIRAKGEVLLLKDGKEIFSEDGEIQFTKTGLSGICIFNATRHMRFGKGDGIGAFSIKLNLFSGGDIREFLMSRRASERELKKTIAEFKGNALGGESSDRANYYDKSAVAGDVLRTVVRDGLAKEILKRANVDESKAISELTDAEIKRIAKQVHGLEFAPTGISGWRDAQCTSGGVSLDEINAATNESLIVPNLYITGELADYDGPCGGYNLTYAWLSGLRAARAIVESKIRINEESL